MAIKVHEQFSTALNRVGHVELSSQVIEAFSRVVLGCKQVLAFGYEPLAVPLENRVHGNQVRIAIEKQVGRVIGVQEDRSGSYEWLNQTACLVRKEVL